MMFSGWPAGVRLKSRAMSIATVKYAGSDASEWTDNTLVVLAGAYRILVLLLICTTFVPDEYFQYVEPSYGVAAGQSIRYQCCALYHVFT